MPTPTAPEPATEPTTEQLQLRTMIAFELMWAFRPADSQAEAQEAFRESSEDVRKTLYDQAAALILRLHEYGIPIRVRSGKQLEASVVELLTHPSRMAFKPGE